MQITITKEVEAELVARAEKALVKQLYDSTMYEYGQRGDSRALRDFKQRVKDVTVKQCADSLLPMITEKIMSNSFIEAMAKSVAIRLEKAITADIARQEKNNARKAALVGGRE
jgi:hypothetical protein